MTAAERLAGMRVMTRSGEARAVRLASYLSMQDVGQSVGVDTSTVGRWDRGERLPKGEPAARYAALLTRLAAVAERRSP